MNVIMLSVIMLSVIMLSIITLSVIIMSVIMVSVIMLIVIMVSVVAPYELTTLTCVFKSLEKVTDWKNAMQKRTLKLYL